MRDAGRQTEDVAYEVEWDGEGSPRSVDAPEAALALCRDIEAAADGPLLVGFTSPSGAFFAIGLGAPVSCATHWEGADPPYFQSRGSAGPDSEMITWSYSQPTELPASTQIPRDDAFAALEEFVRTGTRPTAIEWDET